MSPIEAGPRFDWEVKAVPRRRTIMFLRDTGDDSPQNWAGTAHRRKTTERSCFRSCIEGIGKTESLADSGPMIVNSTCHSLGE